MNDELSKRLKSWEPDPVRASEIRAGVWTRILDDPPEPWLVQILRRVFVSGRPVFATALIAVGILAGVFAGAGMADTAQENAYMRSVTALPVRP